MVCYPDFGWLIVQFLNIAFTFVVTVGKLITFISKLARHWSISIAEAEYADVFQDKMIEVFSNVTNRPATAQHREVIRQNTPGLN